MKRVTVLAVAALAISIGTAPAQAPAPASPPAPPGPSGFQPQSGQSGKDVVWVPTELALVNAMLDMAGAQPRDYLIDLGSGDGRTVITAAKRGIRALGVEYNPDMVALSRRNAETEGVPELARFVEGDIFQTDFSDATVLTLFLLPELNERLRPTILRMKPGTRVVSNTFMMGTWHPDRTVSAPGECSTFCRAYLWYVPAAAAGTWRLPDGKLILSQTYQMLTGTLNAGGASAPISEGRMSGQDIAFTVGDRHYAGRIEGDRMRGRVDGQDFVASRVRN